MSKSILYNPYDFPTEGGHLFGANSDKGKIQVIVQAIPKEYIKYIREYCIDTYLPAAYYRKVSQQ